MSQKFCNVLVSDSLRCIYHLIKAVQVVVGYY